MLKCSLLSKSTLTELFLKRKPLLELSRFSPCGIQHGFNFLISVKLVIRKSDGKILYAQGEEDFADFILSFLTFPLGCVVRMLGGYSSLGSLDGFYKSINDISGSKYFMSNEIKNRLIEPYIASQFSVSKRILPTNKQPVPQFYCYYQVGDLRQHIVRTTLFISDKSRICDKKEVCKSLKLLDPKSSLGSQEGGYVKGPAVFMVTDDLVVTPMTPTSALSLLDHLGTPPTDLMEKIVTIGFSEVRINEFKKVFTSLCYVFET